MHAWFAGAPAALVLALVPSIVQAQQMKLTDRLALEVFNEPQERDPAFEGQVFSRLIPELRANIESVRGWDVHLLRKDRGNHPGRYALAWTPGSQAASGPSISTSAARRGYLYELVGKDRLDPLPELDVIGIHYIKVRPERRADFERFVTDKLVPAVGNLRPDLRLLYYKCSQGDDPGSYITIFALTAGSRDKYWPNGSDSDDLKAAFTPAVRALATELESYLVPDTWGTGMTAQGYEAKDWADWVVVSGR